VVEKSSNDAQEGGAVAGKPNMKLDEREIERVFDRLGRLGTAIIDSSSIIYMQKAGFLETVSGVIKLMTIPQVLEEIGELELPVHVIDPVFDSDEEVTDRLLFAAAVNLHKPMISEDRAILLKCKSEGMEYYNAYNMLVLLRLRGILDGDEFCAFEKKLLSVAHYGRFVIDYVACLKQYLRKLL